MQGAVGAPSDPAPERGLLESFEAPWQVPTWESLGQELTPSTPQETEIPAGALLGQEPPRGMFCRNEGLLA